MKCKLKRFLTEKGFTFIEISVVLLISIILLSFSLPISGAFSRQKLNAAASMMMEDIRLTQKLNENQDNSIYRIKFDCGVETYYISKNVSIYKKVTLPAAVDLVRTSFTNNELSFNEKGVPSMGGTVTLGDRRGNFLYVKVLPVTARVRVDPSPPAP
jgi:Tfp pilus assembly protein PilE